LKEDWRTLLAFDFSNLGWYDDNRPPARPFDFFLCVRLLLLPPPARDTDGLQRLSLDRAMILFY